MLPKGPLGYAMVKKLKVYLRWPRIRKHRPAAPKGLNSKERR